MNISYESVAVSSRIRLARNFKDYPFPDKLLESPHAREQAVEIVRLITEELQTLEKFDLYDVGTLTEDRAAYLVERNLISRDLVRHSAISAALITPDESISVMINEEDHIREQYFMRGYDLNKAYERITGIDDVIAECVPFAFDAEFGYLTACPTNLGTGMRASVMMFLPAVSRRGLMKQIVSELSRLGLTVRGASGEGSGAEGALFQISNEVTLGLSETEILTAVDNAVKIIVQFELRERERMKAEEGLALRDKVMRAYGILSNCCIIGMKEFMERFADLKLGVTLGYLSSEKQAEELLFAIDDHITAMRPANINRLHSRMLSEAEQNAYRAEQTGKFLRRTEIIV